MKNYQITEWCHHFIAEHVKPGDLCIDATAGNGNDTEFLCRLVGDTGKVLAFDIQQAAIDSTNRRLKANNLAHIGQAIPDSHVHMNRYAASESVSCIVFNFGYLPGGDHTLSTRPDTSVQAVNTGLTLLKQGGLMSLCIYSGGDSGFEERDALLSHLKALDSRQYLVVVSSYFNRPNHPPVPALVLKLSSAFS